MKTKRVEYWVEGKHGHSWIRYGFSFDRLSDAEQWIKARIGDKIKFRIIQCDIFEKRTVVKGRK